TPPGTDPTRPHLARHRPCSTPGSIDGVPPFTVGVDACLAGVNVQSSSVSQLIRPTPSDMQPYAPESAFVPYSTSPSSSSHQSATSSRLIEMASLLPLAWAAVPSTGTTPAARPTTRARARIERRVAG